MASDESGDEIFLTQSTYSSTYIVDDNDNDNDEVGNDEEDPQANVFDIQMSESVEEAVYVDVGEVEEPVYVGDVDVDVGDEPVDDELVDVGDVNVDVGDEPVDVGEEPKPVLRFGVVSDETVASFQTKSFADQTNKKINWAVNTFNAWKIQRNLLPQLEEMTVGELNYSVSRFLLEVRKVDGTKYPPNTLYSIVTCIQMHLEMHGKYYKFLNDSRFEELKNTLDNVMKQIAKSAITKVKQAEIITLDEEDIMWKNSILGEDTPKQLVDTVFYLIGLNFALRGGVEHRNLRFGDTSQFTIVSSSEGRYLKYNEDVSKTNNGGLKHRKLIPKEVLAFENVANPERCVVRLFEKYASHRPTAHVSAFYLRPLNNPKTQVWFSTQCIGKNTLNDVVANLCKAAGLGGYRTNHSLRATCASRLYEENVDEQRICEVTGHRSTAVRNYKRTNILQKRKNSVVIQGGNKSSRVTPAPASATAPSTSRFIAPSRSAAPATIASVAPRSADVSMSVAVDSSAVSSTPSAISASTASVATSEPSMSSPSSINVSPNTSITITFNISK